MWETIWETLHRVCKSYIGFCRWVETWLKRPNRHAATLDFPRKTRADREGFEPSIYPHFRRETLDFTGISATSDNDGLPLLV
jgi:hypothetical protein